VTLHSLLLQIDAAINLTKTASKHYPKSLPLFFIETLPILHKHTSHFIYTATAELKLSTEFSDEINMKSENASCSAI